MHEREAKAIGVPLVYRAVDFDRLGYADARLDETLRLLQSIGCDGCNVTHPFKQRVLASLDRISPDAAALGAVNTVVFRNGAREGYNTDWTGFRASLEHGLPGVERREVAQIGCGGAGSATAYALLHSGTLRLRLFDTDPAKASALAARMQSCFPDRMIVVAADARSAIEAAHGVVQTSPVGMQSHPGLPFDPDLLTTSMWVVDIIYFPIETPLLHAARRRGCRTLSGGGMVVWQAADAFRLIVGLEPSPARMLAAF
jgi:shikimate dehydrogenase